MSKRLSGRTSKECESVAGRLGVRSMTQNRRKISPTSWSDEEIETLKTYYPTEARKAFKRIPGRSKSACCNMVTKLGLTTRERCWSEYELVILEIYYPREKGNVIHRLPGRTLGAIQRKACDLGLTGNSR